MSAGVEPYATGDRDHEFETVLDALENVIAQACGEGREVNSMALTDYAVAMRLLAKHGRLTITVDHGRLIIGRWKETPKP